MIKQHSVVTYLGYILEEKLLGESKATKMLGKINGKIKFLYINQSFLDNSLRRRFASQVALDLLQVYLLSFGHKNKRRKKEKRKKKKGE